MESNSLAIVIPAFNEAQTISKVIESSKPFGTVIVVDDYSSDGTKEKSESAGAIVVRHEKNKGYDGALNSGFKKALELGVNFIITVDADGQHNPILIEKYLISLNSGSDLVLGKRPNKARISEWVMGVYFKKRFNIDDILCGMKGYNIKLYKEYGFFDTMKSIGTELAIYAVSKKYNFNQIDIPISPRIDSPRFGDSLRANYKIFSALIRLSFKKFKAAR